MMPDAATLARLPWWYWVGGALGAVYVATVTLIAPRLGATTLTMLVVGGQLAMALVADHFGLVGFARRPLDLGRVAGVALVLAGALLAVTASATLAHECYVANRGEQGVIGAGTTRGRGSPPTSRSWPPSSPTRRTRPRRRR